MSEIFELARVKNNIVSVKVKDIDNLTRSEYPFVSSDMDYISVTRGSDHTMTVIKKDGTTWSVDWGNSGVTMCSDSVNKLKWAVVDFVEKECHVPIGLTSEITEAVISFNDYFKRWQLTFTDTKRHDSILWFEEAPGFDYVKSKAEEFFLPAGEWVSKISNTGHHYWALV